MPLYTGATTQQVGQLFDERTFVNVPTLGAAGTAERVRRHIAADPTSPSPLLDTPPLSEASLRRFFSWHPSVWEAGYGDDLRVRILNSMARLCHTRRHSSGSEQDSGSRIRVAEADTDRASPFKDGAKPQRRQSTAR